VPPVFRWLATAGRIEESEMLRTFNCGIGMIAIVEPGAADAVTALLARHGERVVHLGEVTADATAGAVSYRGRLDLAG
jgi:phosphoribosylformylglycinamidine cyclo-ligase